MFKKISPATLAITIALTSALSGCAGTAEQQNTIQPPSRQESSTQVVSGSTALPDNTTSPVIAIATADKNTANLNKFTSFSVTGLSESDIPLLATSDRSTLFIMKVTGRNLVDSYKKKPVEILKGETSLIVDLYKVDPSTGAQTRIAKDLPYITVSKINEQNSKVAFCGYDRLTVYDLKQNKLLLTEEAEK